MRLLRLIQSMLGTIYVRFRVFSGVPIVPTVPFDHKRPYQPLWRIKTYTHQGQQGLYYLTTLAYTQPAHVCIHIVAVWLSYGIYRETNARLLKAF